MQMKVLSIVILQTLVRSLFHPMAQNFLTSNVLHCSHYHHSLTGLLRAGHSDAHFVKVVVRMGFGCFPSALPVAIWAVMVLIPSVRAFAMSGLVVQDRH
jgi:hypothetical protein